MGNRSFAPTALVLSLLCAVPALAAPTPAPPVPPAAASAASTPAPPVPAARTGDRDDYANSAFASALNKAMRDFYARNFSRAQEGFEAALTVVPDNTLALSFLNAAATHVPGTLDQLINLEEDQLGKNPKNYRAHLRLGFSYMFASLTGRDRSQDAREELNAAVALDPKAPSAHVGLGIMRFNDRSSNRAKVELLAALEVDKNNVLAREYLGQLYQLDLRDPQRALAYEIDVPNLVPGYADILFHIGSIFDDMKQYDAAIKYITQGLEIDTGRVGEAGQQGLTTLANIYIKQHKLTDAKRVLSAAVAENINVAYAKTLLNKIAKGDFDDKTDGKSGAGPKPTGK